MAVGPKPVLSNGLGSPQSIWEYTTSPAHAIGTRGSTNDGRVFYYGRYSASTALVPGEFCAMEGYDAQFAGMAVNTAAVGDASITITTGTTAVTANEYAGGYVVVDDAGTGEGVTYKIDSHPAATTATSCVLTLVDPIYVAFAAATTVALVKSPWADFIQMPAAGTGAVAAGVTQVATVDSSSTSTYLWLQTWGVSAGERDDTSTVGQALTQGTNAGQFEVVSTTDAEPHWAIAINTGVVDGHQPVFLRICP